MTARAEAPTAGSHGGAERFLASGDESGTAPGDRRFRPDVEGLRAVAVALVVLFHAGVPGLSGGYIGVDVFFVISGFVITGVLLRERAATGGTSVLAFYGRRCRRIIPAAALVIVVTSVLAYFVVDAATGARAGNDGRWASIFLANFHFAAIGTNYFAAQQPPSPLQNYWSLSVEEQFYVVYPTVFLVIAGLGGRAALRVRLSAVLAAAIAVSFVFSVLDTGTHPTSAYFSPFTRAWELALGALVAVGTPWLLTVPKHVAAAATWIGLGAVVAGAVTFTAATPYPGSLVAIPVAGAALIIAGGVRAPRHGVEWVLRRRPFSVTGKLSYSLYLWHWPILILAAEHAGRTSLPVADNLVWVMVAFAASAVTYALLENPIRHAASLMRVRWASVGMGLAVIAVTLGILTAQIGRASAAPASAASPRAPPPVAAPLRTVLRLVSAAGSISKAPNDLVPSLARAAAEPVSNIGIPPQSSGCWPSYGVSSVPACTFGDPAGTKTLVLYGDSHAAMWFRALDDVATEAHWKLVALTKGACPAEPVSVVNIGAFASTGGAWAACDAWHRSAIARINRMDPQLLVVSQASYWHTPSGKAFTLTQWRAGLNTLFAEIPGVAAKTVIIGATPVSGGPACLVKHAADVQACAHSPQTGLTGYNTVERSVASAHGARYIDVTPWFCTSTCSPIVGPFNVYYETNHVAVSYSRFLEGVLAQAIDLSRY